MNRPAKILASLALAAGLVIPASAAQASSPLPAPRRARSGWPRLS